MSLHAALYGPDPDRLSAALAGAGWRVTACRLAREVERAVPDLVIATDASLAKRTGHPWIGLLRDDPARLRSDRARLDATLSHDGFLVENQDQARFLTDSLSATGRPARLLALDGLVPAVLAALLADIRADAGFTPPATGPGADHPTVDYIVRVGGRHVDFVRRCLDSLAAQTAPGIGAILVRHGRVEGLEAELERQRPRLRHITLVDLAASPRHGPPAPRSASLWAGLAAVQADLFAMLDDDDALHPNHVASLTPLALAGALAIAGSVQVWDDEAGAFPPADRDFEHRAFHLLPVPDRALLFQARTVVHSSAFLAPASLIAAIGPDPGLDFAEDTWLLRRLARVAPLASSWRVSTDFHWRQGQGDNTAFRPDGRADAMARIADRERLDPVATALRRADGAAADLPAPPAWGQPAAGPALPRLRDEADFHALPGGRPLYVYGSGRGGRIVLAELAKHPHLTVTALLDSGRTGTALGLDLRHPSDLPAGHLRDGVFIIASEHVTAMAATLRALGAACVHDATPHIRLYTALPG